MDKPFKDRIFDRILLLARDDGGRLGRYLRRTEEAERRRSRQDVLDMRAVTIEAKNHE